MTKDTSAARIVVNAPGDYTTMQVEHFDPPTPGPGELLVRVAAAGVNFIDMYRRAGVYKVPYPHVLGSEGSGTVLAVGEETSGFTAGDQISWDAAPGSYATHAIVPASNAVLVPAGVDLTTAAAVRLQGLTAHYLATSSFRISPGDIALIHAGAGGVGLLLTQIAVALGARVITTVSTQDKAELSLAAGASRAILYSEMEDITTQLPPQVRAAARELRSHTEHHVGDGRGDGVDVVYDGVGKTTFDASLASLRIRGTLVLFGGSSGQVPPFDLQQLNAHGSLTVTRPTLAHFVLTRRELESRMNDLHTWIAQGTLTVSVGATYPLEQAGEAHHAVEGRKTTGKVLLIPSTAS